MNKELENKVKRILEEFKERGYNIKEDIIELIETNKKVETAILETKFKKIEFFNVPEENSVGFTLPNMQVNFFIEYGEDEEGKWYEASAEIINF